MVRIDNRRINRSRKLPRRKGKDATLNGIAFASEELH
jgi:hypothetical protein